MSSVPRGLRWRSSPLFIIATVAVGIFSDLFLYGLIVPVLPFLLQDRISVPHGQVQAYSSALLAAYAGASVLFSLPAGWIADKTSSRQAPFLSGIAALLAATLMLSLGKTIAVIVVARVLQGMSGAVVWTVGLAMIMDTVGVAHLGKIMGTIFSIVSVGELAAPVLGGILYAQTGLAGIFGVSAGVLAIDFAMRVLVVEKKVAARYEKTEERSVNDDPAQQDRDPDDDQENGAPSDENSALLPKAEEDYYAIPPNQTKVIRYVPILYCLTSPRLLTALLIAFMQAFILGAFDATIPTEASSLFAFSSLKSGLLFIALDIPYLISGPVAGWTVDKYGPKPAAVFGFGYLTPTLILLRLPHSGGKDQIILFCALLALCGVGMGAIGSPSIVEASDVVSRFEKANPHFFGDNGPYAQLYGLSSLVFSAGLAVGPVLSGALRDVLGYGNMNAVIAALSAVTAILAFFLVGGRPPRWLIGKGGAR